MNAAASGVMKEIPEIVLAYGISDEYRYHFTPVLVNDGLISAALFSTRAAHFSSGEDCT